VFFVLVALAALDALARLTFWGRHQSEASLLRLFDATAENGVPTWFSVVTMALVARACLSRAARLLWPWGLAGLFFGFLSLDDACELHERVGVLAARCLPSFGVYGWVPVLAPVFAAAGIGFASALWRDLAAEPQRRRRMLLGFAALGTAVAIETAENAVYESGRTLRGVPWVAYTQWVEELLEMLGPVLLLAAFAPAAPSSHPTVVHSGPPAGDEARPGRRYVVTGAPDRASLPSSPLK
jgi:hypothetical protein